MTLNRVCRHAVITLCDVLLALIIARLVLAVLVLVLLARPADVTEGCRTSWVDISEYAVLSQVCRDPQARAALANARHADEEARGVLRGVKP